MNLQTIETTINAKAFNPANFNARYDALLKTIKEMGTEAHARVGAHIRKISNGKHASIGIYHVSASVPQEEKYQEYGRICIALFKGAESGDWSGLNGQLGAGAKKQEEEPKPASRLPVVETHPNPMEQKTEAASTSRPPRTQTPVVASNMTPPQAVVKSDDDAAAIATLRRLLHVQSEAAAPVNMDEVRLVVGEELAKLDIGEEVKKHNLNGAFPTDRVQKLIDDAIEGTITRIVISKPTGETREVSRQHYKFPLLIAALSMRLNVALVGPAGSSKTTTAHNAAKALDLGFEAISVGPMTSKADLLGFTDAHGKYHTTATVRRAVEGGIMLWDEFDAANASVATYGNMLLANDEFGTAEGMKVKHKDFCLIAGLNTYGMGANRVYVGRNQLDGATLDRFVVIDWDYDEGLEASIVGIKGKSPTLTLDDGGTMTPDQWFKYVLSVRKACESLAIRHVVSPRATIHGTKLFAAGVGRNHVETMVLFKGLEQSTVAKIKGAL